MTEQIAEAVEAEEENKPPPYTPPPVTTRVDVRASFDKKLAATLVHITQFSPDGLFRTMPDDIARLAFSEEHYTLVRSRISDPGEEHDLLEGLVVGD